MSRIEEMRNTLGLIKQSAEDPTVPQNLVMLGMEHLLGEYDTLREENTDLKARLEMADTAVAWAESLVKAEENVIYPTITKRIEVIAGTLNRMKEAIANYRKEKL